MIPAGYMLKKIHREVDWLKLNHVVDIYSVSGCTSTNFCDYINFWKHNGYWLFDSPEIMYALAKTEQIDLADTNLFYYEVYEHEYIEDEKIWGAFSPEKSFVTNVDVPNVKKLEGYDVVTFHAGTSPEHSPLSCNYLAKELPVNKHCLIDSFEDARKFLEMGKFNLSEEGPFRIFAVYSVPQ